MNKRPLPTLNDPSVDCVLSLTLAFIRNISSKLYYMPIQCIYHKVHFSHSAYFHTPSSALGNFQYTANFSLVIHHHYKPNEKCCGETVYSVIALERKEERKGGRLA